MKILLYILFLLPLESISQTTSVRKVQSIEILSKSVIDSTLLIINDEKSIEISENKSVEIDESDAFLLKNFINDIFITKKYNVFSKIERVDGFRYSSKQNLIIPVKFNENEKDIYHINLSLSDFKVEYSDEFKRFLKLLYRIR